MFFGRIGKAAEIGGSSGCQSAGTVISDPEKPETFLGSCACHVCDGTFRAVTTGDGVGMHIRKIHKNTPLLLFENM